MSAPQAPAPLTPHRWAAGPLQVGGSLERWWGGGSPCRHQSESPPRLLLFERSIPSGHPRLESLRPLLSDDERQQLERLRQPQDRERFLLGRGGLRLLLGMLLNRDPAGLSLISGPHGKPDLAEPGGPRFNVSHSGALVLLALHPLRPVGVDVEQLRPDLDWRPIARRMFSAADLAGLEALPEPERAGGFLRCWCRLEARLKAAGTGLAGAARPQEWAEPGGSAAALWDVAVPGGYRAAAALTPRR